MGPVSGTPGRHRGSSGDRDDESGLLPATRPEGIELLSLGRLHYPSGSDHRPDFRKANDMTGGELHGVRTDRLSVVVVAQGPPARGGISSFATTLVSDAQLARTMDVTMLNTTRRAEREAGAWSIENARNAVRDVVRTYRAARHADVVHVQTALMPALPLIRALSLCAAARLGGAAVLCHVHSGRVNSGQAEAFTPSPVIRALLRMLSVTDGVLTVSRAGSAALAPLVGSTPVDVVDNAVDVAAFLPAELAGDPPTLLYVGTLSRRKGLTDLVEALRLLEQRGPLPYRLLVVGGSAEVGEDEAQELRDALVQAGKADALLGSLSSEQVQAHLQAADVFVLPSHWEGQPIAILEAMASGLPVVVTSVGANPDVVRDGIDGLVVPPHCPEALAEALERLLSDVGLRRKLGASARQRAAEHHDTAHLRARMAGLYQRAAQEGRRS